MSVTLVREETRQYPPHDQLFKELIHNFFEEFLEVFFPEVHQLVDFHSVKPLSEEVFTDVLDGDVRRMDIVVEAKVKGEEAFIIIHVEPQSTKQTNFHERMFLYFSLLYQKYRKPIIPIAVFSFDDNWDRNEFKIAFPFSDVLNFKFKTLHLRNMNWREYIRSENPVAAALLSKMGYTESERIQVKIEFLRMLVRMELTPAKQRLIYGFFESYLKLDDMEEEMLMEEVKHLDEAERILEIPISYEEKGIEKGIRKVAFDMIKEGIPLDIVIKITKLDKEEIEKMKESLKG